MSNTELIKLAGATLELTQHRLMTCLPYLNLALLKMPLELRTEGGLVREAVRRGHPVCSTDGEKIFWEAEDVLRRYQDGEENVNRAYLHMIMHCIFLHPFAYEHMNTTWWDAASDIAIEHTIRSLHLGELRCRNDSLQEEFERKYLSRLPAFTADQIYHAMLENEKLAARLTANRKLFMQDEHSIWLKGSGEAVIRQSLYASSDKSDSTENSWRKVQANVHLRQQNASNRMGDVPAHRTEAAGEILPAYRDYASLLMRFAVLREEARLDPEEFDYIYYTYGLRLYGRVPLIEPLEYREMNKVRDLVIAIDTSGSTQGNKVRRFLAQTCAVLNKRECFFEQMNLHLLQCDCEIQEDTVITSRKEFEEKLSHFELKGGGGTSYIPVFSYARELIRKGLVSDLKGIIYFTDGYGRFPEGNPGIQTAFVLYDTDRRTQDLPDWVQVLRLNEGD